LIVSDYPRGDGAIALLCDADDTLFPSERPAFDASTTVVNGLLSALGSPQRFTPQVLLRATTGQSFRRTAGQLAAALECPLDGPELERWVDREVQEVTAHLARTLEPDEAVCLALEQLQPQFALAAVTSSALPRLAACLAITGLERFFPPDRRFSAEDSLPVPRSKPHPDVYLHALATMNIPADEAIAIEDSVPGVMSAVSAGVRTLGNVVFLAPHERAERSRELIAAGAAEVADSWPAVVSSLTGARSVAEAGAA
jgi:beta-phosphoglucomutase-like phosphatase (HAD superfamily)